MADPLQHSAPADSGNVLAGSAHLHFLKVMPCHVSSSVSRTFVLGKQQKTTLESPQNLP